MPIRAEYVLLQLALPGRPLTPIGIGLLDGLADHLHLKLRRDWSRLAGEEEREVLEPLEEDLLRKSDEMGGAALLGYFEDTLSNALQVSHRASIEVRDFAQALDQLFAEHVQEQKVIPFVTHLPVYSLQAAATRFGEDMEVAEEGWIAAPEGMRLTSDMFVAQVVGRSMEPLIPDRSLCIFRAGVSGSRQGKRLLVQVRGTSESGGEFTVKKYSSVKESAREDGWRHAWIVLEPLNPEFEPMEFSAQDEQLGFRVIAEFVQVLK